jgi:hypothetical protein
VLFSYPEDLVSERQDSRFPKTAGQVPRAPEDKQRAPLDRVKAPRRWKSPRTPTVTVEAAERPRLPETPAASENPDLIGASETQVQKPPVAPQSHPTEAVPELPSRYEEDRLVLLVRDPWWAYAWWEVTDATFARTRQVAPSGKFVLRIYNVTQIAWDGTNHHTSFDIDVRDAASSWFLDLAKPGDSFCAELGLVDEAGRFHAMVRSNAITLPPDRVSTVIDEEWMIPEAEWQRMFEAAGGGITMGVGSGEVRRMMEGRMHLDLSSGSLAERPESQSKERR